MKKVKSLILCALLIASFILSAMPVAMAAGTDSHTHSGLTAELSKFDFSDFKPGTQILKAADSSYDETGTFFINVDGGIEIVEDDSEHGNVAKFTGVSGNSTYGIGISKKHTQTADGKNPEIIKLELELKGKTNDAAYLYVGQTSAGTAGRLMLWSGSDNSIGFYDASGVKNSVVTATKENWKKFTLYFDFGSRNYCAYIDDVYAGTFTIPKSIANLETLYVTAQKTVYVDNLSVYTLPEPLAITSITLADNSSGVGLNPEISAKFNHSLNTIDETMITVTGGTAEPEYNVSSNGDTVKISFAEKLELKTEYTVTFGTNISSTNGLNLGEAVTRTFTTTDADLNSGYTSVIADFNFDDLQENAILSDDTNYYVAGNGTVTIEKEADDNHKNIAKVTDAIFGVAEEKTQVYPAYIAAEKNPGLLKFEIDIKKYNTNALYLYVGNKWSENCFMSWVSGGEVRFKDGSGNASTPNISSGVNKGVDSWLTVTLYVNFDEGKYSAYLDNKYINTYSLPQGVSALSPFSILHINTDTQGGTAYVDNMSITTIPAYEAPVISEFTNHLGENKLAFVGTNTGDTAKAYKILCAKYNSDNTFTSVTISDGSVAASATELEELTYPTPASDGSYYKYFVWNSMSDLLPLVEAKEIR